MRVSQFAVVCATLAITNLCSAAFAAGAKNIVDTANDAGNFTTLVKALQTANLVNTLKGKGPFTVFAPDDAAFAKMAPKALSDLMNNKERLKATLLYHVVKGDWNAKTVAKEDKEQTLQGSYLSVHSGTGGTMIDDATITKGDIKCSNGVIHVISRVLEPQSQPE